MSEALLTPEQVAEPPSETPAMDSLTLVRVDDLIVGRPLNNPVYDVHGVLLLAAGSVITLDVRKRLQQRKIAAIRVSAADVTAISLASTELADRVSNGLALESVVISQLDKVIDSGLLIQNHGPALKRDAVSHGRTPPSAEKLESLRSQRTDSVGCINELVKEALRGDGVSSTVVNELATRYLADLTDDTDSLLAVAMETAQDASIAEHCFKMATLGTAIGIELGMDEENCRRLFVAGLTHDWGMFKVPAEIRHASRKLEPHEFFEIKKHPIYAAEMLNRISGLPSLVSLIVYQVHERPNGTGYPRGRAGDRINYLSRILSVADTYVALTEERPHRRPLAPYSAMERVIRHAGTRDLDPEIVRALLKVLCLFPIGSFVTLSDGSVAQVIRRSGDKYSMPIVQRVQDQNGHAVPKDDRASVIDLAGGALTIVQALPTPGRNEILLSEDIASAEKSQA